MIEKMQKSKDYNKLLKNYNEDDWKKFVEFSDYGYNSIKLYEDENVFLKLICWKKGQTTDTHNHPNYHSCDFKILKGELIENVFNKNLLLIDSNVYRSGDVGDIEVRNRYHIVYNESLENAVSLHIYHKNIVF